MRRPGWALIAVLAGSCGTETAKHGPVEVSSVSCIAPAGTALTSGGKPLDTTMSGPIACRAALQRFFDEHPDRAIVEILPLQYPVNSGPFHGPGTQDLVVLHAPSSGAAPRASELSAERSFVCASNVPGEEPTFAARYCEDAIRSYLSIPDLEPRFVVPLVQETHSRVETSEYLVVTRKQDR
jgi:hypothetical protein